jgi:hypothetical protein
MSLDQYLGQLGEDHYARKQYAELKANALKAVDYANQVIELQGKVMKLQEQLSLARLTEPYPALPSHVTPNTTVDQTLISTGLTPAPEPKKPCPTCGKMISPRPGPWATHQKQHNPVI